MLKILRNAKVVTTPLFWFGLGCLLTPIISLIPRWSPLWWACLISILVAAVISAFSYILDTKQKIRLKDCQKEHEFINVKYKKIHDEVTKHLNSNIKKLHVYFVKNKWLGEQSRLTAYYFFEGNFIPIVRYSQNPEYASISPRNDTQQHKSEKGILWECWRGNNIMSVSPKFSSNDQEWNSEQRDNYGFSEEEIAEFKMHPRRYAAIRLCNDDRNNVGVLIAESMNADDLSALENSDVYGKKIKSHQSFMSISEAISLIGDKVDSTEFQKKAQNNQSAWVPNT